MKDTKEVKPSETVGHEQLKLARHGDELIEAIAESFLMRRFVSTCPENRLFAAARLEGFTRGKFPRILLNPALVHDLPLTQESVLADLDYLAGLVRKDPDGFKKLVGLLDDPEAFAAEAGRFGLTEGAAQAAGGGLLFLILVVGAALVLTGCPGPTTPPPPPPPCPPDPGTGLPCVKAPGHVWDGRRNLHRNGTTMW